MSSTKIQTRSEFFFKSFFVQNTQCCLCIDWYTWLCLHVFAFKVKNSNYIKRRKSKQKNINFQIQWNYNETYMQFFFTTYCWCLYTLKLLSVRPKTLLIIPEWSSHGADCHENLTMFLVIVVSRTSTWYFQFAS